MLEKEELTREIIGAAIEVHRALGPGLLESAYEECLCRELSLRGIGFRRQVEIPVEYKGVKLDCAYRADMVVRSPSGRHCAARSDLGFLRVSTPPR